MSTTVNIHEAKTHLSRLLEQVRRGERVIISKAGVPVAELPAYSRPDLEFGVLRGQIHFDNEQFVGADADAERPLHSGEPVDITITVGLGRITIADGFADLVSLSGWIELSVRASHASAIADFPTLARHDPFDRILLAQAASERLTFLTVDRRLLALGHDWIVDATA